MSASNADLAPVWHTTLGETAPEPDRVHIWALDLHDAQLQELADALELPPEDRHQARLLGTALRRARFLRQRALRRLVLAEFLGTPPGELRFDTGPRGKPALRGGACRFNTSHSENVLLLAATAARDVGVDVEVVDPQFDFASVAREHFTAAEQQWLQARPDGARREAFYRIWTAKEAWLKALGLGLAGEPREVETAGGPDGGLGLARGPGEAVFPGAGQFAQRTVVVGRTQAVAAVAVVGPTA